MTQAAARLGQILTAITRETADPSRCVRVLSAQVIAAPKGRSAAGVILGAGVLLYKWMDLSILPRGRRRAAVGAQLRAWSPFADSGFRVIWFEDSAGLFAWDDGRLHQRLAEAAVASARKPLPMLPEPWLYTPPAHDAVRLLRCFEGVEAQVWQRGSLRASRWWPEPPDEAEWLNFQRGAGLAPGAVVAVDRALQDAGPPRAEGWGPLLGAAELQSPGSTWESVAAIAASLALMAWTAVLAHDQWQLHREFEDTRERLEQLRSRTEPVIAARETALREAQRAGQLAALLQGPDALLAVEHVLVRLPQLPGIAVRQLDLNGRQMQVALAVPEPIERAGVVTDLENGGWLVNVRETREGGVGTLNLSMALNSDRAPVTSPPPPRQLPLLPAPQAAAAPAVLPAPQIASTRASQAATSEVPPADAARPKRSKRPPKEPSAKKAK